MNAGTIKQKILDGFRNASQNEQEIAYIVVNKRQLNVIIKDFSKYFSAQTYKSEIDAGNYGKLYGVTVRLDNTIIEPLFFTIKKIPQALKKPLVEEFKTQKLKLTNKFKFIWDKENGNNKYLNLQQN